MCPQDVLRLQLSRLLTHLLRPDEALPQTLFALELVANDTKCREILKLIIHVESTVREFNLHSRHRGKQGVYC